MTKVKFSSKDKYVVTTGGNDKTVIIWDTDFAMDDSNSQMQQDEEDKYQNVEYEDDDDFIESKVDKSKEVKQLAK